MTAHGLSEDDLREFQSRLMSEVLEEAHLWSCFDDSFLKEEIAKGVMEKLVACYQLTCWSLQAFPEPEPLHDPIEDDDY